MGKSDQGCRTVDIAGSGNKNYMYYLRMTKKILSILKKKKKKGCGVGGREQLHMQSGAK